MLIEPLGDRAYLLRNLVGSPLAVAAVLNREGIPGLIEAVAAFDTIGLYVEPESFEIETVRPYLDASETVAGKRHEIPVCYELGEDLSLAAERLGLGEEELVRQHASVEYRCFALGFCPGFPYLRTLPEVLQGVPRLDQPRARVEPGSVGITGLQTGIYPMIRPGGWSLIGRTPLTLVDVEADFFPISAGDVVVFRAIGPAEFQALKGERL